jgi:hypothetical protein
MKNLHSLAFVLVAIIVIILSACGTSEIITTTKTNTSISADNWLADGIINDHEYSNEMRYFDYFIYWRNDNQYVYIGIRAKTLGYVAFGIQPGSGMKDADIIIGFVENGNATVSDSFSIGDVGPHPEDTQLGGTNNIIEYGGSESDGYTTIEFKRELNTGDEYDIPLLTGSNKIMWSISSNDGLGVQHTTRGYGEIIL